MAFIKAAEKSNLNHMISLAKKYPHIGTLVNPEDPLAYMKPGFWALRDHALQLAREQITHEAKLILVQIITAFAPKNISFI